MTIQIFVENAIKHGLKRQGGMLTIRASRQGDATLVEVVDNGQGLDSSYQEHTGMRVVRQTIQMLNERNHQQITFGIDNLEQGCCSWLLLPDNYNYNIIKR
jgi:sensor histidine kinase YesM